MGKVVRVDFTQYMFDNNGARTRSNLELKESAKIGRYGHCIRASPSKSGQLGLSRPPVSQGPHTSACASQKTTSIFLAFLKMRNERQATRRRHDNSCRSEKQFKLRRQTRLPSLSAPAISSIVVIPWARRLGRTS